MSVITLPLTSRPFLSWEGKDSINNKARITGCPEEGFLVEYYDESEEQWLSITAGGRAQWILEGFLADCMAKQAGVEK